MAAEPLSNPNLRARHGWDCALEAWGRDCPDTGPPDCTCELATIEERDRRLAAAERVVEAAREASEAWGKATALLVKHGERMAAGTLAAEDVYAYTDAAREMAAKARALADAIAARDTEEKHGD